MSGARALSKMTARERLVIAAGAGLVLAAFVGTRVAPALVRTLELRRARAQQSVAALRRAQEAVGQYAAARESLTARAGRLVALAPRLFGGETAAETSADLVSFVSGRAALRQVRILRQDIRGDSAAAPLVRMRLRVDVESDITGLASWIADLEEGPKLISFERLHVTALEPGATAAQSERLHAEVVLIAWGALSSADPLNRGRTD